MHGLNLFIIVVLAMWGLPPEEGAASSKPNTANLPANESMRGERPGATRNDNLLEMTLVWCPPGKLTMHNAPDRKPATQPAPKVLSKRVESNGHDDEVIEEEANQDRAEFDFAIRVGRLQDFEPVDYTIPVQAFIRHGYWLGKYEVTQAEWKKLMGSEPWKGKENVKEGDDFPASYLTWHNAMEFCRKLTAEERDASRLSPDWEYTLPTEAQWERACRARTETRFYFGNDEQKFGDYGWCSSNTAAVGEPYAHRTGLKAPNGWGLHDMHGNVWEWCRDTWREKLPGGIDPVVIEVSGKRILRGGGIYRTPSESHSSFRHSREPEWRLYDLGFRVALCPTVATLEPKSQKSSRENPK